MGKSYYERGDTGPRVFSRLDEDDEEFDYREYLRQQEEEEAIVKEIEERMEIQQSLDEWHSMTEEEKQEFINKSKQEK